MSWSHGTVEPSVVDEGVLQGAVEEQGPQQQAGRIAKEEGVHFNDVTHLRLEYKHILKIEQLQQFTSLTKLQLNNNIIEKIEGLACLPNLTWLDLSFNHIERIEGLDSLVKLEDLSLYSNRISVVENMDPLRRLQILSLGNNLLDDLQQVVYLRRFKDLHCVNLAGNPICKDEDYKSFIAAYLPNLAYLDYRLLDEHTKEQALTKHQDAVEKTEHEELQVRNAAEDRLSQEEALELHQEAFVELLNGSHLYDSMFTDDPQAQKLSYLSGIDCLLQSFKHQLGELCVQVFEAGLVQQQQREAEVQLFFAALKEAVAENQQMAAQLVTQFEKHRRKWMLELQEVTDAHIQEVTVMQCHSDITQFRDSVMTLEMNLVDQLEELIKDFERNISNMVGSFTETAQGIFAQCRDLENNHHKKVMEVTVATLEKVAKNTLEEELPDDVRMLFVNKDILVNTVNSSHEKHLLHINNREDELVTRVNLWMGDLLRQIQEEEVKRNRLRVSEINTYITYVKDQLHTVARDSLEEEYLGY